MRLCQALLILPLFCAPAFAETAAPSATDHPRRTAEQHFADANTTHDGRLTLEQAMSGYKSIAKSFSQIDVNRRGYVTLDDIKAWRAAKKAARQAAKRALSEGEPGVVRPAMQRGVGVRALDTSTDLLVPAPLDAPRTGVDVPGVPLTNGRAS